MMRITASGPVRTSLSGYMRAAHLAVLPLLLCLFQVTSTVLNGSRLNCLSLKGLVEVVTVGKKAHSYRLTTAHLAFLLSRLQ